MSGSSTIRTNLVRDVDVSAILPILVIQGGGHTTLANGRGIRLDFSLYQESAQDKFGFAEIYFLRRNAQGQYSAYAFAGLSAIDATYIVETFGEVVALWLRGREVSDSKFGSLCVQIFGKTDEIWLPDTGLSTIREDGR